MLTKFCEKAAKYLQIISAKNIFPNIPKINVPKGLFQLQNSLKRKVVELNPLKFGAAKQHFPQAVWRDWAAVFQTQRLEIGTAFQNGFERRVGQFDAVVQN